MGGDTFVECPYCDRRFVLVQHPARPAAISHLRRAAAPGTGMANA